MKKGILLAIAIGLLTLLAPGGTARADDIIPADDFSWQTLAGPDSWISFNDEPESNLPPIPADFFDPGCDPFTGQVPVVGFPLDPAVGTTDTIVRHPIIDFTNTDFVQDIPIEIVQLSLRSVDPIQVNCPGGTQQWDVEVTLDPNGSPPGSMNFFHPHSPGFADIDLFLCLRNRFTRLSDGAVNTMLPCQEGQNPVSPEADLIPWGHPCDPGVIVCGPSNVQMPLVDYRLWDGQNISARYTPYTVPPSSPITTIIIKKETVPSGSQVDFSFVHDIGFGGGFSLSDGEEIIFRGIPPGDYEVTEEPAVGFVFALWHCLGSDGVFNVIGADTTAIFDTIDGETITCTFINRKDSDNDGVADDNDNCPDTPSDETADANGCSPGQPPPPGIVIIIKRTVPSGSSEVFNFTQNIDSTGPFSLSDGQQITFVDVPVGTYGVFEAPTDGFLLSLWRCLHPDGIEFDDFPSAIVRVLSGETTTCTFTNKPDSDNDGIADSDDHCPGTPSGETVDTNGCSSSQQAVPGHVNIELQTNPPSSPGVFPFTQNLDGGGPFGLSHGQTQTFLDVPPGAYNVTQGDIDGFVLDGWECDWPNGNSSGSNPIAGFQVIPNQTVTCIFFNDTDSDNDGVGDPGDLCLDTPADTAVDATGCNSDRIAVGGVTSFLDGGSELSGMSAAGIAIFAGTVAAALVVLAAGGWYGQRRLRGIG